MSVSLNKSTDKDMSLLTFKAHRSKIQMAKNFHSHNTEEQLKITSRSPYPIPYCADYKSSFSYRKMTFKKHSRLIFGIIFLLSRKTFYKVVNHKSNLKYSICIRQCFPSIN